MEMENHSPSLDLRASSCRSGQLVAVEGEFYFVEFSFLATVPFRLD